MIQVDSGSSKEIQVDSGSSMFLQVDSVWCKGGVDDNPTLPPPPPPLPPPVDPVVAARRARDRISTAARVVPIRRITENKHSTEIGA